MEGVQGHELEPLIRTRGVASRRSSVRRFVGRATTLGRTQRRTFAIALIGLTILSPDIPLPGSLPALRLDQIALVVSIPLLATLARSHARYRRLGLVDAGFVFLFAATLITLALAPLVVPAVDRSPRDVFELVRIVEYWIAFRLGMTLVPVRRSESVLSRELVLAALPLGLFAIAQYVGVGPVNTFLTPIWTQDHNLDGVIREGRAVGTAGNANQFAIFATMLLFVALARRAAAPRAGRLEWLAAAVAIAALLLAQSRGAVAAAAAGAVVAFGLIILKRRARAALGRALPPVVAGAAAAVMLMAAMPPPSGSAISRFDVTALMRDPSLIIRLGRVESLLQTSAGTAGGAPGAGACATGGGDGPDQGHEPGSAAPPSAADATVVDAAAEALGTYLCDGNAAPSSLDALVPRYVSMPPGTDPTEYGVYVSDRGYAVGSEGTTPDVTEPSAAGTFPNLLSNPSFEIGTDRPSGWIWTPGSEIGTTSGPVPFGTQAASVHLPAAGALYQLVVADLPRSVPFTASMWVRATGPSAQVEPYVVAILADGRRMDPLAKADATVAADGQWHLVRLGFQTPDAHVTSLQVMLRAPVAPADLDVDGASLTEGPYALPFPALHDAPASLASDSGPGFRDSPLIGVGPQKDEVIPAFDNEYAAFLQRYGLLGLLAYVCLFAAAGLTALRAAASRRAGSVIGLAMAAFTVALGVFAVTAGSYRQLQVMVTFWVLVGACAAARRALPLRGAGDALTQRG